MATKKRKTQKRQTRTVFAKGEYLMAGESQTEIKNEVNENTPEHMIPSVPKAVSGVQAKKMVQTKAGGFKKEFDWTKTRMPRITPKTPRLR